MTSASITFAEQVNRVADEIFEHFLNSNEWPLASAFKAERLGEVDIQVFDRLESSGRVFSNAGRYELGFEDITRHPAWKREERICNSVLEILRTHFKAAPNKPVPIEILRRTDQPGIRQTDVRRATHYLSRLSYVALCHQGLILTGVQPYENVWRHKAVASAIEFYNPGKAPVPGRHYVVRSLKESSQSGPTADNLGKPRLGTLHPGVKSASESQYNAGHYRDAVLNAFIAVFDLLRERSGLTQDGHDLVNNAFSIKRPILSLNALVSESDKNEQLGFMEMLKGAYTGIRNPKAHTLKATLKDPIKAFEYLAFASLLARTIDSSKKNER